MDGTFEERLAAVERALTDGDHDCTALAERAATADRVAQLEADVEELTDRVAELEAAIQALRGYVGNVRSVNGDVEARAEAALSKAETARRLAEETGTSGGEAATPQEAGSTATTPGPDHRGGEDRCDRCNAPLYPREDAAGTEGDTTVNRRSDQPRAWDGDDTGKVITDDESRLEALGGTDVDASGERAAGFRTGETDGGQEGAGDSDSGLLGLIRDAV